MDDQRQPPEKPVDIGLSLPNRATLFGLDLDVLFEAATLADRDDSGFDSLWIGDNLLSKPRTEAIALLSALAGRTTRLRLGTVCLASFPLRHPLTLAIQWASLDQISGGRTIMVVCLGGAASWGQHYASELAAFDVRSSDRVARLEEGIQILRAAWEGQDPLDFDGSFYRFKDVTVLPKPGQDHVPIVIATNPPLDDSAVEERALRRIARLADGWQTAVVHPDIVHRRWNAIQRFAVDYGRSEEVHHLSVHLMVNIHLDEDAAKRDLRSFLDHYYEAEPMTDQQMSLFCAWGRPERVAARLSEFLQAGVTTLIIRAASMDQIGQIRTIMAEVVPLVRDGNLAAYSGRPNESPT